MISYLKKVFFLKSRKEPLLPINTECTICLSNMDNPFKTKCNHYFHKDCLDKWVKIKNNCPNCRKSLKYLYKNKKKQENLNLFIRRLRRVRIAPEPEPEPEPELQIEERRQSLPQYISPPTDDELDEFLEIGNLNGICDECGRNVYQSYKKHPDGNLIYHKRCFNIMFERNGRQL